MALIRVTWRDAAFDLVDEAIGVETMTTVGWLIHQDDDCVRIASERYSHEQYRGITVIPLECVTNMETLEGSNG